MDRKKVEIRLSEWARASGFLMPDGSLPKTSHFTRLFTTPRRCYLWEVILDKVQPKYVVQRVRKQILVAALKSDERKTKTEDCLLSGFNSGILYKLALWKKKENLEKKIIERKKEIDDLRADVYKKAHVIQMEVCKVAGIEKQCAELQEKIMITNLILQEYKRNMEKCSEILEKIKSLGIQSLEDWHSRKQNIVMELNRIRGLLTEDLERNGFRVDDGKFSTEINAVITNETDVITVCELLLEEKRSIFNSFGQIFENYSQLLSNSSHEESQELSLQSFKEQIMLDITENSLQALSNRYNAKEKECRLKEIVAEVEKLTFNQSALLEASYMGSNEKVLGDSLTGRKEKMTVFLKALSYFGLKKRLEVLRHELEKLVQGNQKNLHWTEEKEKLEKEVAESSNKLKTLREEIIKLLDVQKSTGHSVLRRNNELKEFVMENLKSYSETNIFNQIGECIKDIRSGIETEIELVHDIPLDAFRKVTVSPGKVVYERESLAHCLDNYGGELQDLFSSILISPFDKPKSIIAKLEDWKAFVSHIDEVQAKDENDLKNSQLKFAECTSTKDNTKLVEKNYEDAKRILSRILSRNDILAHEEGLIKKIFKHWVEQPYRLMIPDSVTLNSMTLRQFEEKYQVPVQKGKHPSNANTTFLFK